MPEQTVFEHPLTEKCRTWLRLSHLFEQFDFHVAHDEEWQARAAVAALLDIATVLARADIKSELLKELERYRQSLSRMSDSPGVDTDRLPEEKQRGRGGAGRSRTRRMAADRGPGAHRLPGQVQAMREDDVGRPVGGV